MKTLIESTYARATLDAHGVATLTIQGAKSLNILGSPVIADLTQALALLAQNSEIRVLILRGSGDKAFVAGANIVEMSALTRATAEHFIKGLRDLCEGVRRTPVPVIARIPGWALGGGLELATACDIRIASRTAQFGMPEVKVGIPSVIHAALLPRLIGQGRADWLLLTGELIDAETALAWGLVNQVVDQEALDHTIESLARSLCALGPAALRQPKMLLRRWETLPLAAAIDDSVTEFGKAFETGEPQRFMGEFARAKAAR